LLKFKETKSRIPLFNPPPYDSKLKIYKSDSNESLPSMNPLPARFSEKAFFLKNVGKCKEPVILK
jgi:hypothetical protein